MTMNQDDRPTIPDPIFPETKASPWLAPAVFAFCFLVFAGGFALMAYAGAPIGVWEIALVAFVLATILVGLIK